MKTYEKEIANLCNKEKIASFTKFIVVFQLSIIGISLYYLGLIAFLSIDMVK